MVRSVNISSGTAKWTDIASVPAPDGDDVQEGLAGAYAAPTENGVLIAGGANFPGARAVADAGNWYAHKGLEKHWASEIFALQDGVWKQIGTLPEGMAYGGSFAVNGGLLVVGGEDSEKAARADVFLVQWNGKELTIVD